MQVKFYARETHFFDHLFPIWEQTGGEFYCGSEVIDRARAHGISPIGGKPGDGIAVVAGLGDLRRVKYLPAVFVEHGAGQGYSNGHPSHPGGPSRENVILYINPSEWVAERNRAVYPDVPNAVVGCPKLDRWHPPPNPAKGSAVAISFHWNARTAPESLSAWGHYRGHLMRLKKSFPEIIGHAHPRMLPTMAHRYREYGIEIVADFAEVIERAAVYVCDNSSTMYEFASLDRPVVVLNAPWYRRHVTHGLRFWEYADVGVQVNDPRELVRKIEEALTDPPAVAERRREIVSKVYAATDGKASVRAAAAIKNVLSKPPQLV